MYAAHPTRYQGEPVGETAELENDRKCGQKCAINGPDGCLSGHGQGTY